MASTIAAITTGTGGVVTTADATGNLSLLSGATTVVAVTAAGASITGTMAVSGTSSFTGAVTLTGGLNAALPVLSGGTGVTTSTGTGAVVLGTSPTLVTPLLGTPTSGNLANCTGISLPAGSVLQVLSTRTTTAQTITGGFVAVSGLSVSITPQSASNKVLVQVSISYGGNGNDTWNIGQLTLYRDATAIGNSGVTSTTALTAYDESKLWGSAAYTFLDSPATTSATAYTVQIAASYNGIRINTSNENTGASTITVTEIRG